jgi:RND superfamily putative drug exporter
MTMSITGRIARTAAARPWLTISVWLVVIGASIVAAGSLGDVVTQEERVLVATDSDRATELDTLHRAAEQASKGASETFVVTAADARFGDPAFTSALEEVAETIRPIDGVRTVSVPTADAPFPVSEAGDVALVTATVDSAEDSEVGASLVSATEDLSIDGFAVTNFGEATGAAVVEALSEETLIKGEVIGIGVAIIILIIVFGALVAAGVPLLVAIVSIITAVGATAIVGRAFELSFFVLNMITMMGLALGIDYTLVMVQRFREELASGRTVAEAVAIAGNTANRAVLFSGVIVVISLMGLLVVPSTIMRSLGAGAIIVAVSSVVAALTLLPAVLRLLGHRVNKGRIPGRHPGAEPRAWKAIARGVTGRPVVSAVAGLAVLAALALPMTSMRLTFPGTDSLPADNSLRQASETLVTDFGYGSAATLVTVEGAEETPESVDALVAAVEADPAYAETTVEWVDGIAFIDTKDVFDAASTEAEEALDRLRTTVVPAALEGTNAIASVGGEQAESVDFTEVIRDSTPWVLAIVLGASFLMLLVTFRSVLIPFTAIVLNVLSAAAAFGLMVAVFQFGWGADLLGLPQVDGIAPWIPLFLFAVLFGLSMDYHVFLLSRIKEHHDKTGDNRGSIVFGLSRTGSMITGAALIMVAVFSGFAMGDLAEFAQMGFGLAAAVIIDATIVRTLLVPALMTLFGKANWYLPSWLQWLPAMHIEGEPVRLPAASPESSSSVRVPVKLRG